MATVKIKFRPSSVETQEGSLYYQVIHRRTVRQINVGYKLFPDEWNSRLSVTILPLWGNNRKEYLLAVERKIARDIESIKKCIAVLDRKEILYTVDDLVTAFEYQYQENSLFRFMQEVIVQLKQSGQVRTSETYVTTLNSFMRFRNNKDISWEEINSSLMIEYEAYLKSKDINMNTISFYMRILRAVYNRAVKKGLTEQEYPFRDVYTGIKKTVKRAISFSIIKKIKELPLSPDLDYARDLFLFSLYTRGMSFVDMAYLKKSDLKNGTLSYCRRKTGQWLFIKWEQCMQDILNKYPEGTSPYLLPIIRQSGASERRQYKNALMLINRRLKIIGKQVGLSLPLTMYVARHSWATIARSRNVPLFVISECMGHDSETTTQIYLASLDTTIVDNANRLVLKGL